MELIFLEKKINKLKKKFKYQFCFFLVVFFVIITIQIISGNQILSLSLNVSLIDYFILLGIIYVLEELHDVIKLCLLLAEKIDKK